jgi:hypothetical protein
MGVTPWGVGWGEVKGAKYRSNNFLSNIIYDNISLNTS